MGQPGRADELAEAFRVVRSTTRESSFFVSFTRPAEAAQAIIATDWFKYYKEQILKSLRAALQAN